MLHFKRFFFLPLLFMVSLATLKSQSINGTITHDGMDRDYLLYVPESYDADTPTPLVFNFHGLGSSAFQQSFYGSFRQIADTAAFIVVHPDGSLFNGTPHWNVGGFTIGSTVDDVGFTAALIDSLSAQYNIDPNRVYATGMSNGGYMSFLLACQLGDRFAAVASVTGSMTPSTYNECVPDHPTPVLQIHGTSDGTVPYNGASFSRSIEDVVDYWVDFNQTDTEPVVIELDDADPNDGSTVEHYIYTGGTNGSTVEHFKVLGGGHTWPGSAFTLPGTNNDFDASQEIWRFFRQYDLATLSGTSSTNEGSNASTTTLKLYPNPASDYLVIEGLSLEGALPYRIYSQEMRPVLSGQLAGDRNRISVAGLISGIYYVQVADRVFKVAVQ